MQRDARAYGGAVAGSAAFLAVLGRFFEASAEIEGLGLEGRVELLPESGKFD